jgi:hypothetical protein
VLVSKGAIASHVAVLLSKDGGVPTIARFAPLLPPQGEAVVCSGRTAHAVHGAHAIMHRDCAEKLARYLMPFLDEAASQETAERMMCPRARRAEIFAPRNGTLFAR